MTPVTFYYLNHRGEVDLRTVDPFKLEWVPDPGFGYSPGWFLTGHCLDRKAIRSFALQNIQLQNPSKFFTLVNFNKFKEPSK